MSSKLVRDHIPEIITQSGKVVHTHTATSEEYLHKLVEKLQEECKEYSKSYDPEELADILEVVYALGEIHKIPPKNLETIRKKKKVCGEDFRRKLFLNYNRRLYGSYFKKY